MARHQVRLGTLTIPLGGQESNSVINKTVFGHAIDLIIYCPNTATTGVVTLQVTDIETPSASDWRTAYRDGADISMPGPAGGIGKAYQVPIASFVGMRLRSASVEAADAAFDVVAQVDMAT